MKKHQLLAALLVLLLCVSLAAPALAAGDIDLTHANTLTVCYQDGAAPLSGAQFDLYLVATTDRCGELTATGAFASFPVNISGKNDDAWRALASTLEGCVALNQVLPTDSGTTDTLGRLTFPTTPRHLTAGLYLLLGRRHMQNGCYYDAAPCMVLLPTQDLASNTWLYDVTVAPKFDVQPIPPDDTTTVRSVRKIWADDGHTDQRPASVTVQLLRDGVVYDTVILSHANNWRYDWSALDPNSVWTVVELTPSGYWASVTRENGEFFLTNTYSGAQPPTPTNPSDRLPQTGLLWWPVPLLAACGLAALAAALLLKRRTKS